MFSASCVSWPFDSSVNVLRRPDGSQLGWPPSHTPSTRISSPTTSRPLRWRSGERARQVEPEIMAPESSYASLDPEESARGHSGPPLLLHRGLQLPRYRFRR